MISCYHLQVSHPRDPHGALFDDVSFELPTGSWTEIVGEPGCGKSVLFSLLSLRTSCSTGKLLIGGRNLNKMSRRKLAALRRRVASASSQPVLLEERTVLENLLMPLVARRQSAHASELAAEMLARVGIASLQGVRVAALTPEERRLVAIARACIGKPSLLLIDGGVEGLSTRHRQRVLQMLRNLHRDGATVVLFSREANTSLGLSHTVLRLEDGKLDAQERSSQAPSPEQGGRRR